ncbi:basic helix-loop-helix (bHLH) DNA-bindingsuperfamily protein, partial [Striga asiatica]
LEPSRHASIQSHLPKAEDEGPGKSRKVTQYRNPIFKEKPHMSVKASIPIFYRDQSLLSPSMIGNPIQYWSQLSSSSGSSSSFHSSNPCSSYLAPIRRIQKSDDPHHNLCPTSIHFRDFRFFEVRLRRGHKQLMKKKNTEARLAFP